MPKSTSSSSGRARNIARRVGVICVLALVAVGIWLEIAAGSVRGLPATATSWLDSFTAAAARDPGRLCSQLVTAAFRTALLHDLHESCVSYYSHVHGEPIRILRILQSGDTAAVEIRYWPRGLYTTFVLSRDGGGWRAVAIVPGGPLPAA